jgi:hypothetical protein
MQTLPNTSFDVFVNSCTLALQKLASNVVLTSLSHTLFHSLHSPRVTLREYVERIVTYAPCTVESFVVSLVYLDRIAKIQGTLFVNPRTIHRLFLTSLLLAAKYCDDVFFNNKHYSRIGGISGKEMNALELEFLFRIKFECNVSTAEFNRFSHILYEPEPFFPLLRCVHPTATEGCYRPVTTQRNSIEPIVASVDRARWY